MHNEGSQERFVVFVRGEDMISYPGLLSNRHHSEAFAIRALGHGQQHQRDWRPSSQRHVQQLLYLAQRLQNSIKVEVGAILVKIVDGG